MIFFLIRCLFTSFFFFASDSCFLIQSYILIFIIRTIERNVLPSRRKALSIMQSRVCFYKLSYVTFSPLNEEFDKTEFILLKKTRLL